MNFFPNDAFQIKYNTINQEDEFLLLLKHDRKENQYNGYSNRKLSNYIEDPGLVRFW